MRILVTGIRGQLGYDVMRALRARGLEAVGVNSEIMDIRKKDMVDAVFDKVRPNFCIHPAAWTAVDKAEDEPEAAYEVNAAGTAHIASACARHGAGLMYFSTDYVFDGEGERSFGPDDATHPINVYGSSKLEGEKCVQDFLPKRHFILRLEWVYGINGKNFVKTMLKLAKTCDHIRVVNDQIGSPSYTVDIAKLAVDMVSGDRFGTYHVANAGFCSWYEFAKSIFAHAGINMDVQPVTSKEYPTRAKRPHNSRFDTSRLKEAGFELLPPWEDALKRFLRELGYRPT